MSIVAYIGGINHVLFTRQTLEAPVTVIGLLSVFPILALARRYLETTFSIIWQWLSFLYVLNAGQVSVLLFRTVSVNEICNSINFTFFSLPRNMITDKLLSLRSAGCNLDLNCPFKRVNWNKSEIICWTFILKLFYSIYNIIQASDSRHYLRFLTLLFC